MCCSWPSPGILTWVSAWNNSVAKSVVLDDLLRNHSGSHNHGSLLDSGHRACLTDVVKLHLDLHAKFRGRASETSGEKLTSEI